MNIDGFTHSFRVGSHKQVFVDVFPIGVTPHSDNGMMVVGYMMSGNKDYIKHKVEIRKRDNYVAIITYHYDDAEINPYWRDAEVIFSWTQPV